MITEEQIKKTLKKEHVIEEIIKISKDNMGSYISKVCGLRDYIMHELTGYYWDEIEL